MKKITVAAMKSVGMIWRKRLRRPVRPVLRVRREERLEPSVRVVVVGEPARARDLEVPVAQVLEHHLPLFVAEANADAEVLAPVILDRDCDLLMPLVGVVEE